MKRILFFNYEYPPLGGGAANATAHLLQEYAKRGDVHVELITSALDEEYECLEIAPHVIVHRIPIGKTKDTLHYQTQKELLTYTWRSYRFALQLTKEKSFDLTHSFFAIPCGVISLALKWQRKLPYVVSLRGADVPGYSDRFVHIYKYLTILIRRVWKGSSFVVTNSKGLTELAQKSSPQQPFEEIFNGIDTQHFSQGMRNADDRTKEFRILCASRLSHRKGFHYAIDALPKLIEKYPHVKMIFAGGDGGVMQKLKGQAQALSVHKYVSFTGHYVKDEAPDIYRNADLFLMPSLNEGMSNNLLEALASGMPVLMTPVGGAEELVHDGDNGYLLELRNGDDIAKKIITFIENDEQCVYMGRASRDIALSLRWEVAAQKYVALYNKTVLK